jgi:poly(3-hydroxybutyrate) depolymerase
LPIAGANLSVRPTEALDQPGFVPSPADNVTGDIGASAFAKGAPTNLDKIRYGDTAKAKVSAAPEKTSETFPTTPGDHRQLINGREYEVHVPKGYDGHSPLKVMYVLHGFLGDMDEMRKTTRLNEYSDQRGFAVVYLQGQNKDVPGFLGLWKAPAWNLDHGSVTDKDPSYDDMDYIRGVVDTVGKGLHVGDPKKNVFFAGYSEGGMAAQYVGEQIPCAGVATVDSSILTSDPRPKPGEDPKKFIAIMGEDDNFVPIKGGHGWFSQWRPLKGFMTITFPYMSRSEPLEQAKVWAAAEGDTKSETKEDKYNTTTLYTGGAAPVEQQIHKAGYHNWWFRGGMHEWSAGQKNNWWFALREADPTQNDSTTILNFFGL